MGELLGQIFETGAEVNVSHIIHDLSFGPTYPGVHNPLDGNERILHDTSGTFKYFLKVGWLYLEFHFLGYSENHSFPTTLSCKWPNATGLHFNWLSPFSYTTIPTLSSSRLLALEQGLEC